MPAVDIDDLLDYSSQRSRIGKPNGRDEIHRNAWNRLSVLSFSCYENRDKQAMVAVTVKVSKIKTVVLNLNAALATIGSSATFEFNNENKCLGQDDGINSLTTPWNWIFQ
jgi:hypothetical protein